MTREAQIVLALDAAARRDVLELAQHVAGESVTRLFGLFIEDPELREHARSRLAREILVGGIERPFDAATLERRLRAESAAVRRLLEAAAAARGLACSFEIARGEPVAELVRRAAQAAAVVVDLAGARRLRNWQLRAVSALARTSVHALLVAQEGASRGRNVMALIDEPERARTVLDAASRLAQASGAPLLVLLGGAARTERERLAAELTATSRSITLLETFASRLGADELAHAARGGDVRVLVAAAEALIGEEDELSRLLRASPSTLLLVRTALGATH